MSAPQVTDDARLAAVVATLHEVYTDEGVDIWWTHRNKMLGGLSARDAWDSEDETLRRRVEAVAESLTGQVAT